MTARGGAAAGIEDFARVIELARIVYQVELDGAARHLIDSNSLRVDVCAPGVQGYDDPEGATPKTWRVTLGEEDDGGLARGEGATLTDAIEVLARAVEARAAAVRRAMLAAEQP